MATAVLSVHSACSSSTEDVADDPRGTTPASSESPVPDVVQIATTTDFAGRAFRITYETSAQDGPRQTASGLLMVPEIVTSRTLTSYQHSSAVARDDVPTVVGTPHWAAAATLARSGRLVVSADYLGLGASPGVHRWLDAVTETAATAGLLRVVPQALESLAIPVPDDVDLVGFSQGAHATMALARHLESTANRPFRIRTVIGIAGPYMLSEVDVPALVAGTSDPMVRSLALSRLTLAAELGGADVDDMYADGWRSRSMACSTELERMCKW